MTTSLAQVLLFLTAGIAAIVVLTAKLKVHAFFALIIACFIVGLGAQLPFDALLASIKQGFGNIMQSLGLIIVLGTTLGVLLEHTGCTRVMAEFILRKTGDRKAAWAMSITGFIVGLPIFCDSGYIVLSGLNQSLSRRTGTSVIVMAVSLATGLYSVHCLLPPHPGAAFAADKLNISFGKIIPIGILVAIPGMIAGHVWARFAGRNFPYAIAKEEEIINDKILPPVHLAFLPVIVPVLLIALNAFIRFDENIAGIIKQIFSIIGDPAIALAIGVLLALATIHNRSKLIIGKLLQEGAEKAGGILVIIGAGGAFGAVLAATKIGDHFSQVIDLSRIGIVFPFLLAFILKTAQGSSTVAIMTSASIVLPLLNALGLDSENGRFLAILSMGAGSMMISHANDAYFWVISRFSGIEMRPMLKVYSIATILMGIVTFLVVYILSLFLL